MAQLSQSPKEKLATDLAPSQQDTEALAMRVQALPRELINHIYDLTFTSDAKSICVRKPPALLQVDSHSRKMFAERYYRNTTFCFVFTPERPILEWYVAPLPLAHAEKIPAMIIHSKEDFDYQWFGWAAMLAAESMRHLLTFT